MEHQPPKRIQQLRRPAYQGHDISRKENVQEKTLRLVTEIQQGGRNKSFLENSFINTMEPHISKPQIDIMG
jgi:hypothetical protein